MSHVIGLYNYWIVIFLMMTGFYVVIARSNLIQKVIGLNIFQISVFLLYITMGKVTGGTAPIFLDHGAETGPQDAVVVHAAGHSDTIFTHPLPSVLMLTAIVVGIATTALALSLVVRIGEAYGTIEEDEILQMDRDAT